MVLQKHKTVRQALEYIEAHPDWPHDGLIDRLDMPIWEMVARNLYDIAMRPDTQVVGALARATRAQKILLDRLTGTRRMGTHPAVRNSKQLKIKDLTVGVIPEVQEEDRDGDDAADTEEATSRDSS